MRFSTHPTGKNTRESSFLMTLFFSLSVLFGGLFCLSSPAWASTSFAKQDGVKITAKKSPRSKVLTTLKLGDAVTVLSVEGRMAKVKTTKGKTGWVFKFRLSPKKPTARGSSGLFGLKGRKKIAARESRAGGSIRGLKESTEQYAKDKHIGQEHQDAVDRMEALVIPPDELLEFKKAGHLGEFSGGAQ